MGSSSQELEFGVHSGVRGGHFEQTLELSLVPELEAWNRSCELVVRAKSWWSERSWWSELGAGGQSKGACDQSWKLVARADRWRPEQRACDQSWQLGTGAESLGLELVTKVGTRNGMNYFRLIPPQGEQRLEDVDRDAPGL